jgi:hypothetical protein
MAESKKIARKDDFLLFFLHMCKKSSTFVADFRHAATRHTPIRMALGT